MLLCAMAPAREPARSRSWILSISWSVPMNRLICGSQNRQTLRLRDFPFLFSLSCCSHSCLCPHLLIGHELDGWLGCNLQHVDAISSPQWPWATLPDHLREAADDAHVVTARGVNLGDRDKPGLVPVPITTVQRFSVIQGQKGAFLFTQRFAKALIPSR